MVYLKGGFAHFRLKHFTIKKRIIKRDLKNIYSCSNPPKQRIHLQSIRIPGHRDPVWSFEIQLWRATEEKSGWNQNVQREEKVSMESEYREEKIDPKIISVLLV